MKIICCVLIVFAGCLSHINAEVGFLNGKNLFDVFVGRMSHINPEVVFFSWGEGGRVKYNLLCLL